MSVRKAPQNHRKQDLDSILPLFPKEAQYYFCSPNSSRGLSTEILQNEAKKYDLIGEKYDSVEIAFAEAKKKDIGIIARVPLASGLLTGKFDSKTTFDTQDHRNFNRNGEAFDKGETFSGIDYNLGLKAVEELKALFPETTNLAPIALQWILSFSEVSCIIPGTSTESHVLSNLSTFDLPALTPEKIAAMNEIYNHYIKKEVHHLW